MYLLFENLYESCGGCILPGKRKTHIKNTQYPSSSVSCSTKVRWGAIAAVYILIIPGTFVMNSLLYICVINSLFFRDKKLYLSICILQIKVVIMKEEKKKKKNCFQYVYVDRNYRPLLLNWPPIYLTDVVRF